MQQNDIDIVVCHVSTHPFLWGGKHWMTDSQTDVEIHQQGLIEFSVSELCAPKPQHMQRLSWGHDSCLISGRKSPATCTKSKQIQTGSENMTENTCRKISVKKKYMTHSGGNLAQEKSPWWNNFGTQLCIWSKMCSMENTLLSSCLDERKSTKMEKRKSPTVN